MASFKCDSTILIKYAIPFQNPDVEKNFDSGVYTHRLQNNFEEGVSILSFNNFLRFVYNRLFLVVSSLS